MVTPASKAKPAGSPNAGMAMSAEARARMRGREKLMLKYYNDMGRNKGNCTWGIGFYAHKDVCSEAELKTKVDASAVDMEYAKRLAEAERRIKLKVIVPLNQKQFDALVSFTYNTTNATNSRVYDALNGNKFSEAASMMSASVKVKINGQAKLAAGLVARRAEESEPFRITAKNATQAGN